MLAINYQTVFQKVAQMLVLHLIVNSDYFKCHMVVNNDLHFLSLFTQIKFIVRFLLGSCYDTLLLNIT